MKNLTFQSTMNFSFFRLLIIKLTIFLFLISCVSNERNAGSNKNVQVKLGENSGVNGSLKKNQEYLLVGAQGRAGKGAVFRCNLDGTNCIEFLGGNLKFQAPENQKQNAIILYQGNLFGSSIFVTKDKILIGAMGRDNKKATDAGSISNPNFKEDIGGIFQCNLDGSNCIELLGGHIGFSKAPSSNLRAINLMSGDYFGSSLFVTKDKILIGAAGRDSDSKDSVGAIFQCSMDGKSCVESMGGKNKINDVSRMLEKFDAFGSSIYVTNSNIFLGAKSKNDGNGTVFKCNLNGEKCMMLSLNNIQDFLNNNFGSSLAGNSSNIYIGAIGRNGYPATEPSNYDIGAVFKCNIDGKNCIEIVGGENKSSTELLKLSFKDYLGSSLAVSKEYLYIGSFGRKNSSGQKTGSVFRCQLDGKNCIELIAGKNNKIFESDGISLLNDDLFGSSLAIVSIPN